MDIFQELFKQSAVPQIILNEQGIIYQWNDAFIFFLLEFANAKPEDISIPFFEWLQHYDPYQYTYYFTEL
ncbi:MAG TPA: hypothetical protein PLJ83_09365, partial [Spirochaetales bacterium]|nr:hypothetical protein [Spirochaetales bacterium]